MFAHSKAVSINLDVEIRNDALPASGNNILAVTGGNANYAFTLQFSDANIGNGDTDMFATSPITPVISSSVADNLAATATTNLAGTAMVTLASGNCIDTSFLCLRMMTTGIGASYLDFDSSDSSNVHCQDISAQKSCFPGIFNICTYKILYPSQLISFGNSK